SRERFRISAPAGGSVAKAQKVSGRLDARRMAGAAARSAQRSGAARAMRFSRLVSLLHQQSLPPRAVLRQPGSECLRATALAAGEKKPKIWRAEHARIGRLADG